MSSFSIQTAHKDSLEWREIAYRTVDKDDYMLDVAISLFAGLGTASFASPLAGIAVGAFLVKRIFDKEDRKIKAKDLIRQNGLVAPFLDDDDFRNFVDQVGSKAVYAELKFADDLEIELRDRAWDFLELYEQQHPNAKLEPAPEPKQVELPNSSPNQPDSGKQMEEVKPETPTKPRKIGGINAAEIMTSGKFIISRLIIGASRTGKSQLASDGLGYIRLRFGTAATIYYLSAGYIEEEDGHYWTMCDRVSGFYFPDMNDAEKRSAYKEWNQLIEDFTAIPASVERPKILVIDELNSAISTADRIDSDEATKFVQSIRGKLADVSSMGSKRGLAVWGIAPTGAMGDMCLTRANVSAMNPVFLAQTPNADPGWNELVFQTANKNGIAPKLPPSQDLIDECEQLGLDRLIAARGKWMILGDSPNVAEMLVAR